MTEVFGEEVGLYTKMYKLGLWLTVFGLILFVSGFFFKGDTVMAIAFVFLFIGIMLAVTGYTGYRDEKKKFGTVKHQTWWGLTGTSFGIASVFIMGHAIYVSLALAVVAIVLGVIAKRKGDNVYAEGGTYIGIISIVGNGIIIAMLMLYT